MDTLFLLEHEFEDPALPILPELGSGRGIARSAVERPRTFYCRDCILLEGLLAKFPERTAKLNIVRLPYPRPRHAVVDAIGEENQWLPVLVLGDGDTDLPTGEDQGTRFINDIHTLLAALHERHGFPEPHP